MPNSWSSASSPSTPGGPNGGGFDLLLVERRSGYLVARVSGQGAAEAFAHEAGGHRWQEVSPTDKRGRVHTSTITVAALPVPTESQVRVSPSDLEWRTARGSGAGGQHRNTTDSAVQLTHKPTGLTVYCQSERSQHQNKAQALDVLRARLAEQSDRHEEISRNRQRKGQVGAGQRGDKRRTIALQRGQVTDHRLGRRMAAKPYLKGDLSPLVR